MVWLSGSEKQTFLLSARLQMWSSILTLAMTLTLNFQGWIFNLLYLRLKSCDCHEMKNKHINCLLGLIHVCGHQFWPWPWPWPFLTCLWPAICQELGCWLPQNKENNFINWIRVIRCELDITDSQQGDFWCQVLSTHLVLSVFWRIPVDVLTCVVQCSAIILSLLKRSPAHVATCSPIFSHNHPVSVIGGSCSHCHMPSYSV